MALTEQQRQSYIQQLQWQVEQQDDWIPEWERISALQQQLVTDYGAEGLELWLSDSGLWMDKVYAVHDTPESCPWHLSTNTVEALQVLWGPICQQVPHTVATFTQRCRGLFALQRYGEWLLVYVLEAHHFGRPYWTLRIAGAPADATDLGMSATTIPTALVPLYRVHNGFGCVTEDLWTYRSFLPCKMLGTLRQNVEQNVSQDVLDCMKWDDHIDRLIPFYVQARGELQCVEQHDLQRQSLLSVTVDDNLQMTGQCEVYAFIDAQFSKLDSGGETSS